MTNQEAINKLTAVLNDDIYSWSAELLTAFSMAVDALRGAEGDCISRQDAIEDAREAFKRNPTMAIRVMDLIKSMPSAQPDHIAEIGKMDCISRQAAIAEFSCCELTPDGGIDANYAINFLEQMPSAQPEQRWIPCSVRLPAYGEDVLISIGGYCNVGHIVSVNEEEQYNWYFSGWYHSPNDVDAWMPLPEPWKEDEER